MTNEQKMEMYVVASYGLAAAKETTDEDYKIHISEKNINFMDRLITYANTRKQNGTLGKFKPTMKAVGDTLPDVPVFLAKYVE